MRRNRKQAEIRKARKASREEAEKRFNQTKEGLRLEIVRSMGYLSISDAERAYESCLRADELRRASTKKSIGTKRQKKEQKPKDTEATNTSSLRGI